MTITTNTTDTNNKTTTTILRVPVPREWSLLLDHLSIDLQQTKQQLLAEAVVLLLRYHGRGEGLPEPLTPG